MNRIARSGIVAAALWCAASAAAPEARATTFANLTIEQTTDAATWIVEGKVTRVWTELDEDNDVWTRAEVDLDVVHKGPGNPDTLIVDSMGGVHGDVWTAMPGRAVFSEGEQVFLFLDVINFGRRLAPVAKFKGKYTVRRAAHDTQRYAMTYHPPSRMNFEYDHRFMPHPEPEYRLYVGELRRQVKERLDEGWDGKPIPGISMERLAEINGVDLPAETISPDQDALR